MALGKKRSASKAAGGAHKKRAGAMAKKCGMIVPTLRDAEFIPQPVRKIIHDRLVHVFGTYKEERHPFQEAVSNLVGNIFKTTEGNLQAAINQAQGKKAGHETEGGTLTAANDAALAVSEAAAQAMADSKTALANCNAALKDAKAVLHDLEAAVKTAEVDASSTTTKKEKLESVIKEFFVPVKEGTIDKGLSKSAAYVGKHLGKEFGSVLEREFLVCAVRTFSKPASAWLTFDHIINKELEEFLKHILAGLAGELEAMAAAEGPRAANVEAAKGAVVAAEEKVKAAEEASTNVTVAAKEAKSAAKAATAAVKQQQQHIEKAASCLEGAEHALTVFREGPLSAYTEVEAHAPPPPEPEKPVEPEPAAVETEMAAVPAPAARMSPSIASSPRAA